MKNKVYGVILIAIFIFIVYIITQGYIKKFDVEDNGKESVGKYVSHDSWGKGEVNIFKFYVDGKIVKGNGGRAPRNFSENIGKFYKIKYSKKFEGTVIAFFDEQVTDTTEILKAGFSKEDLGNVSD